MIIFKNCCESEVILCISDENLFLVRKNQMISVQLDEMKSVDISVQVNSNSFIKKSLMWGDKYHLVLLSQYKLAHINENEVIEIKCENIDIKNDITYKRVFLDFSNKYEYQLKYSILKAEEMQKSYQKNSKKWEIIGNVVDAITLSLPFSLCFGLISKIWFKWKISAIIFIITLIVLGVFTIFIKKIINLIAKHFKSNAVDDKLYFSDEYINVNLL